MSIDWEVSPGAIWMLLGVLLILFEFVAPGVIAMFLGAAAIIVGVLLLVGVPMSLNAQIVLFGVLSLVLVVAARRRVASWFRGRSEHAEEGVEVLTPGTPVTATSEFSDGTGVVSYRGARWNAESADPIVTGQRVWITGRRGLVLQVSAASPERQPPI
jgi:membrane protein implicated in regulation of membrane protease activity